MKRVVLMAVGVLVWTVGFAGSRAHAQNFTMRALTGRYSILLSGWDTSGSVPVSLSGVLDFNGAGIIRDSSVLSYNDGPTFCSFSKIVSGAYAIEKNGTGQLDITLGAGDASCIKPPMLTVSLVVSLFNNGRQANISTIATTVNNLVLGGTMSQQKTIP